MHRAYDSKGTHYLNYLPIMNYNTVLTEVKDPLECPMH